MKLLQQFFPFHADKRKSDRVKENCFFFPQPKPKFPLHIQFNCTNFFQERVCILFFSVFAATHTHKVFLHTHITFPLAIICNRDISFLFYPFGTKWCKLFSWLEIFRRYSYTKCFESCVYELNVRLFFLFMSLTLLLNNFT